MADNLEAVIEAIMARASAGSGQAVFVDRVILRKLLEPLVKEIEALKDQQAMPDSFEVRHHIACDPGWGPRNYRCHPDCKIGR